MASLKGSLTKHSVNRKDHAPTNGQRYIISIQNKSHASINERGFFVLDTNLISEVERGGSEAASEAYF